MSLPFAVQKAADALLVPALAALTPPVLVYDHAPQNAAYPFVEFVRTTRTADHNVASDVWRIQIAIAVFSDFRGQEQVANILHAISEALDDAALTLETGQCWRIALDRDDIVRDADGVTYTGTALFTAEVQN
jgi:hypothetical protein